MPSLSKLLVVTFLLSFISISYAFTDLSVVTPVVLPNTTPQLIAGYPFEEGGGSTVLDLSGNGNNGTLAGEVVRSLSGETGEAIDFNGSDSSINLGAMDITTPTMSIALWFKPDDFGVSDGRLISKADGISSSAHYWMISTISHAGQKRLRFRLKTENGGTSTLIGNAALIPSVWTHVSVTYDGVNMKLFQNGIEIGSLTKTGAISTSSSIEAWIGANPSNNKFFDGLIDDVRLYGEALDGATIQDIIAGNLPLIDEGGNNTDTESPTSLENLTAQPTATQVNLNWTAATDNVGIALYRISIDGTEIGTTATTSFQATGLNAGQSYSFSVIAEDASGNQSTVATVTTTTLTTSDTVAPSVPTGLTLDSATVTSVSINWTASTDDQGAVINYHVFRNTVEVGTSVTTGYTDNTVQAEQKYLYTILAIDDSGNESGRSGILSVITPMVVILDTSPPTVPADLILNSATASSVSISWTASKDIQGIVALYHIMRDGSEIGTSTVASYTDDTVASETTYVYTVTAEDNSTNESDASTDLSVVTPVVLPNTTPQLIAGYPFEEGGGSTVLDLSGNGNNGTLAGEVVRSLSGETGEAIDFNGSDSSINLGAMDITTPTMSIALWFKPDDFGVSDGRLISKADGISSSAHYWMISTISHAGQKRLRFRLKTENGGTSTLIGNAALIPSVWTHVSVTYDGVNMKLFQNGIEIGSLTKTGAISTSSSIEAWIGANPSNNKFFDGLIDDVRLYGEALDGATIQDIIAGNLPLIDEGGNNTDTESPTSLENLTAQPTATQVNLNWTAATDNVGIALYRISIDGTEIGTTATTSFQATGLNAGQSYSFSVIAEDASGNQSTVATVTTTTLTTSDTVAPSVPTGLTLDSATANAVSISWTDSSDNEGTVYLYHILRDGNEIGTATGGSYTDDTVIAETTYVYSVTAEDYAANESEASVGLTVATIINSIIKPKDAARFLTQTTFGPTLSAIHQLVELNSYENWLNEQFNLPASYHRPQIKTPLFDENNKASGQYGRMDTWWDVAVFSEDQLRQRIAFTLSEILVVSDIPSQLRRPRDIVAEYYDILVHHSFGNFRDLIEEVTLNPAMGIYLSMLGNDKPDLNTSRRADENYAREILQLFSIGLVELKNDGVPILDANGKYKETYTQTDVENLARIFTGWAWDSEEYDSSNHTGVVRPDLVIKQMIAFPKHHDMNEKSFLGVHFPAGQTPRQDLELALDSIFQHPNVGPFIGKQLIMRLVTSNPSPAYVSRVAQIFNNNGEGVRGDLQATVKAIFLDQEARRSEVIHFGKLKEPLIRLTHFWRAFNASTSNNVRTYADYDAFHHYRPERQLSQAPMHAPSVFNFYKPDFSPHGLIKSLGLVAPEFQITSQSKLQALDQAFFNYTLYGGYNIYNPIDLDLSIEMALVEEPEKLISHLDLLLNMGNMSNGLKQILLNYYISNRLEINDNQLIRNIIALIISSAEYSIQK